MRQPSLSHRETSTFLKRGRALLIAAMLGASTVIAPAAWAQDASPEASPAATPAAAQQAQVTTLMGETFEEFPPAPMTVRMLRITLEPGASTPMHTHPGPEFDLIERGELTIRTEGDAPVTRADGTEEVSSGEDIVLGEGDWILFPAEVGMYYINEGDEPVELLSAVMLPVGTAYPQSITYTDGQPTSQDFVGVSFIVLGDGLIQDMPGAPVDVTVNSVVVPAGVDLPAFEGVTMHSAIDGNFSFIVEDGMVQVSRSELASLQPNAVTGEEFILEDGDAAFFPAGVEAASRADESGELELLTLEMAFEEPMSREPAQLTFTSGVGATGDATGGPETETV
jgi:quercetin dioxygenase-like cupin family protein